MMKKLLTILFLFFMVKLFAQDTLPVTAYKGTDTAKPLIFYISGDGGLTNSFSSSFIRKFNRQGYSIIGLNSRTYFWTKRKPKQAADDISKVLAKYMKEWNYKTFVLIGYSFGADVAPFIQNHFLPAIADLDKHIILMSPTKKTDFEIHILDMIGIGSQNGESVPAEINKLTKPVTMIFGGDENDFPVKVITSKNVQTIKLPGGHHYDGNVDEVIKQITDKIK